MFKKPANRSPLKEKPLRHSGQGLDREIQEQYDSILFDFMFPAALVILVVETWIRWIFQVIAQPYFTTVILVISIVYTIYKVRKKINLINRLKLARDGEMIVGQSLDELRNTGARILHDLQGANFNIDHVVISQHGIYLIETKTYSKPNQKEARVEIKNGKILINGRSPDRDPIAQATNLSKWLADRLQKSTGKKFSVKPVVVFPGWWVEPMKGGEPVWVLNPKALRSFITNEPEVLKEDEMQMAFFHLAGLSQS